MRLALAAIVIVVAGGAARADSVAPYLVRQAMVGCWNFQRGATLELAPVGKHSLTYRSHFAQLPRGGPAERTGDATWVHDANQFELPCRPLSQHGSFCRISLDATSGLGVRVYAHGYNNPTSGLLVEDFVATRCKKP
jgi:hypothetical protein